MAKRKAEGGHEFTKKTPATNPMAISRAVSACQRCRAKKVKCDSNFPNCDKCTKAGVTCVGLDPATGREVPRSYISHLEQRIQVLEALLKENGIQTTVPSAPSQSSTSSSDNMPVKEDEEFTSNLNTLMDEGTRSAGSKAPSSFLDSKSEISFARLMYTALKVNKKSSRPCTTGINETSFTDVPGRPEPIKNGSTTRSIPEMSASSILDPSKQDMKTAILPPKSTAQEFLRIYFAQSNSQNPILHREEFIRTCFVPIYGPLDEDISLASNYTTINYSFATPQKIEDEEPWFYTYRKEFEKHLEKNKEIDPEAISENTIPPPNFHRPLYFLNMVFAIASSVHHLQYPETISYAFRTAAVKYLEPVYSSNDPLESLQGILLLAVYSIMRPAVPGIWYVLGSALRVVVDLGLHVEHDKIQIDPFTKDKRRRLFWCTYSLDRQICFYLGRPVGIPEESINVSFPSELDDAFIIPNDDKIKDYSQKSSGVPTYKSVALAIFRIRQIQSEVQRILYENAELPRRYNSLHDWKVQTTERLAYWKLKAPKSQRKMNCDFNLEFFNLNYNHTVIMLHGISPANYKLSEDDYQKVSEAAKELIHGYHQLYHSKSINYTWAAVHNLFMAGSSYLYTIYYSARVRARNSFDEVKRVTQECITVLGSLASRCDAATSCRETYEVLTAAIMKLRYGEVVHGIKGSSSVSAHQLVKSSSYNHINRNLEDLVEDLKNEEIKSGNQEIQETKSTPSPYVSSRCNTEGKPKFHLNPFKSPGSDASLSEISERSSAVGGFEWVTNNENTTNNTNGAEGLDIFFDELENLSPDCLKPNTQYPIRTIEASPEKDWNTNTNTNSNSNTSVASESNAVGLIHHAGTDMTLTLTEGSDNTKQDNLRVYELIHQMPTESIWDQFFTSGFNPTLPNIP